MARDLSSYLKRRSSTGMGIGSGSGSASGPKRDSISLSTNCLIFSNTLSKYSIKQTTPARKYSFLLNLIFILTLAQFLVIGPDLGNIFSPFIGERACVAGHREHYKHSNNESESDRFAALRDRVLGQNHIQKSLLYHLYLLTQHILSPPV